MIWDVWMCQQDKGFIDGSWASKGGLFGYGFATSSMPIL